MKEIPLTRGLVALVDEEDFERVAAFKWRAMRSRSCSYAVRNSPMIDHERTVILLHRFILGAPAGTEVDHRDGNGLNCQRANLRICSHAENMRNRMRHSENSSGYKGVTWNAANRNWFARIHVKGKVIHLGVFHDPIIAARAYDRAAIQYFGEFARPNFGDQR